MKYIAIIPARGGSKRIPHKNIVPFNGKPMIAWTIEAAIKSNCFDDILVSTDDAETAHIARQLGADVPFLRDSAFDDYTPVSIATLNALLQMEDLKNKSYSSVVQLMANCPLRTPKSIREMITSFEKDSKRRSLISAFEYGMANPWWAHEINNDGVATPTFKDKTQGQRSQDLPKLYCPTGAVWISDANTLKGTSTFYSQDYRFHSINWIEAIDIDDYNDLQLAKIAIKMDYNTIVI